jgi:peptidoglycan-associated lipoprotein
MFRSSRQFAGVRRGARAVGLASISFVLTLVGGLVASPLGCDHDDQCSTEGHKGVCVDHLCTECRDDDGCPSGQTCTSGACKLIVDFCDDKHPCDEGKECGEDKRCHAPKVPVECDDEHPCAGTAHCENDHCVHPPTGGPGCTDFPAVHFDYDSHDLPGESNRVLKRLAECVTTGSLKGAKVLLTGHCDPRGENEFNMVLGAERAEAVRMLLTSLGVTAGNVTTSSRGKLDATGADEGSWVNDRRVDIEIR